MIHPAFTTQHLIHYLAQKSLLDLSVVIVNYNVKYFLEQCLFSVLRASHGLETEVFVVDNASTDNSKAYLQPRFPSVNFRWNQSNVGFGKACNQVLPEVKGEYVLFLNPDTIIPEDCFSNCISFAKSKKKFGALGCRMIDGSGYFLRESKRMTPTPRNAIFRFMGLTTIFPRSSFFSGYYAGHLPEKESSEVEVLAGAFMFIHGKALKEVGGFDEAFFMYGEDIDLSYRLRKHRYRNYYFPGTTIIHFKGESTQKNSPEFYRNFYGAMKLFVNKHYKKNFGTYFMKAGIGFSSLIKKNRNPPLSQNKILTAIVAEQHRFNIILQMLKYAPNPMTIVGRITPDNSNGFASICKLPNLAECIRENKFNHLILAQGVLSFRKIITVMDEYSGKAVFLIHAENSRGIVGSSDKNHRGIFITANENEQEIL